MNISRITALRGAAQFGLPVTVEPAELTEMLNAVEARHNHQDQVPARPGREFSPWFRELEQIAGCAYRAKDIAWFCENGWRKGRTMTEIPPDPKIGLPADKSQALFAAVIVGVMAALLLLRGCVAVVGATAAEKAKHEAACAAHGMELVYSSVSRGKSSETLYMCRDNAGLIHALPAEETP